MHSLKRDMCRRLVYSCDSFLQGCSARGDAEHATTGGDQATILQGGSGVKNLHALYAVGLFDAADGQARAVCAGIAARGKAEADGVAWMPQYIDTLPLVVCEHVEQVCAQKEHERLRLGIAKARVVF